MKTPPSQSGFSAIELLITLLIGFLFVMMGYQLYAVSIQGSGDAREQSKLSSLAYEKLRTIQSTTVALTCPSTVVDSTIDGGKSTMTTTITCPYAAPLTSLKLVVVKVKANNSQREVSHAIYVSR
jgi:Tfp pilus assembly protein PilV